MVQLLISTGLRDLLQVIEGRRDAVGKVRAEHKILSQHRHTVFICWLTLLV